jgi:hypothetical protein
MGPTGIITCAAQFVEGKIVGQVVGEAYQVIEEISPEAAQVISTYNQVKGYIDLGAKIKVDLSIDGTGSIREGAIGVGDEEISIGTLISKNLNEGDIKVSNADIYFSEECENWQNNNCNNKKKITEITFINDDWCNDDRIITPCDENYIPSKNGIFSQTVYDKDTGESIEVNTEILEGWIEFDYETGAMRDVSFRTGDKETTFLVGIHEVYLPPNSDVEYITDHSLLSEDTPFFKISSLKRSGKTKEIWNYDGTISEETLPIVFDVITPKKRNINGEFKKIEYDYYSGPNMGRLESGVMFKGRLTYDNDKFIIDEEDVITFLGKNSGSKSEREYFEGHITIKTGPKEIITINPDSIINYNEEGIIDSFNLEVESVTFIALDLGENDGRILLDDITSSKIEYNLRSDEDLIPQLSISQNGEDSYFSISNGLSNFRKDGKNFKIIPRHEFSPQIHTPGRFTLLVNDDHGKSILGSNDEQKKIVFNQFGDFITVPIEEEHTFLDKIIENTGKTFSERLSFTPTLETLNKEFEKEYGLKIIGFNSVYDYRSLYNSLELLTPEMINSINILEMQEGEIKRSIGGFANPFNNKITINENINDMEDTLIHEIGHTFTFDLGKKNNKLFKYEFENLNDLRLKGVISTDEFKLKVSKLKEKYPKGLGIPLLSKSMFMKKWDEISEDPYGKDLGEGYVGAFKIGGYTLISGNANTWTDGTMEPRHGCLEEYGCNNHWEDSAVFIEESYKLLLGKNQGVYNIWKKDIIKSDPRYLAKLELLKEYNAISEELYNKILDIVNE